MDTRKKQSDAAAVLLLVKNFLSCTQKEMFLENVVLVELAMLGCCKRFYQLCMNCFKRMAAIWVLRMQ